MKFLVNSVCYAGFVIEEIPMNFDIYCSAFLRNHRTQCRIRLHILCRDVSILLRQRYLPQQQLATVVHTHLLLIEVPQYPVSQLYQLSEIGGPNLGLPTVTETQRKFLSALYCYEIHFHFYLLAANFALQPTSGGPYSFASYHTILC